MNHFLTSKGAKVLQNNLTVIKHLASNPGVSRIGSRAESQSPIDQKVLNECLVNL